MRRWLRVAAALAWYQRLLGSPPTFLPNDIEAVWELAEHRSLYIEQRPEHAGHAMHTVIVDDFDALLARIADRGLEPAELETYSNGVRKAAAFQADRIRVVPPTRLPAVTLVPPPTCCSRRICEIMSSARSPHPCGQ